MFGEEKYPKHGGKMKTIGAITTITLAVALLLALTGCTATPTATTQAPAPAAAEKVTYGQQKAFADKLRGVFMDELALQLTVQLNDDAVPENEDAKLASTLEISQEYMSEVLARQIMKNGLLEAATKNGFSVVRFATKSNRYDTARIWDYHTDGTVKTGLRMCDTDYNQLAKYLKATQAAKDAMKYPTTCKYELDDGLPL